MAAAFLAPTAPWSVEKRSPLPKHFTAASRPARATPVAPRRSSVSLSNAPRDDDNNKQSDVDWDSSWKTFRDDESQGKTVKGEGTDNVFQLPTVRRPGSDMVDDRTNKLTSAWTSESGYLVGILVIAAIACLEGYVWWQSQH